MNLRPIIIGGCIISTSIWSYGVFTNMSEIFVTLGQRRLSLPLSGRLPSIVLFFLGIIALVSVFLNKKYRVLIECMTILISVIVILFSLYYEYAGAASLK